MKEGIPLPSEISFVPDKKDPRTLGRVIIGPCFPGYGETIGNSLRRVLLSSLPGWAAHGIKIDGVDHEFSTIDFVREDVIEIILNMKQVRFIVHSDEPVVHLELDVKGERVVTASDISKVDTVEVVNPDQVIATLTDKKAKLRMDIFIDQGRGYIPVEQRENKKLPVGMIAIDSIYTPVQKVNFQVENIRVGQMTNFDKITMTIQTDGTKTPQDALNYAAKILVDHYSLLQGDLQDLTSQQALKETSEVTKEKSADKNIAEMKFSTRTYNALIKNGVKTLTQLSSKSEEELLNLDGFGKTALDEVRKKLKKVGIEVKKA